MNYSKKTSSGKYLKVPKYRKHYLSFCTYFIVGILVGAFIILGAAHMNSKEPVEPVYGIIEGRQVVEEVSFEWKSDMEVDFVPLDVPMDEEMQEFVYYLSNEHNIDFPFVMALINQESSFREDVVSGTNDFGLMQINEVNHRRLYKTLGVTDFLDPYENIRSGVFILGQLFEKYQDPAKVLMAYNMGETGASRLWNKGIYSTDYVEDILLQADKYNQEIQERMGENDQV